MSKSVVSSYFFIVLFVLFCFENSFAQTKAVLKTDGSSVYTGFAKRIQIVTEGFPKNAQIIFPSNKFLTFRQVGDVQQSNFYSNINGKITRRNEMIFTVEVTSQKAGEFLLKGIIIKSNQKTAQAAPIKINFIKPSQNQEILVSLFASKDEYYFNEPVLMTLRIDSIASFLEHRSVFPFLEQFNQYNAKILRLNQGSEAKLTVNQFTVPFFVNKAQVDDYHISYETAFWFFPTETGELQIDPFKIQAILNIQGTSNQPISVASSQALNIKIKELPSKAQPLQYKNAVGDYRIESFIIGDNYKVDEAIPLTIKIEARNGIIRENQIVDIEAIEAFTAHFTISEKKIITNKPNQIVYSYKIAPKNTEVKKIPNIEFHTFNPALEKYLTISAPLIPLTIKEKEVLDENDIFIPSDDDQKIKQFVYTLEQLQTKSDHLPLFISLSFPPFLFLFLLFYRKWQSYSHSEKKLNQKWIAAQLKMLDQSCLEQQDKEAFIQSLAEHIQIMLCKKFNNTSYKYTQSDIYHALSTDKLSEQTANAIIELMNAIENIKYYPDQEQAINQVEMLEKIKKIYPLLFV